MRLYTQQALDLRSFRSRLDRTKGTDTDSPTISQAKARLYDDYLKSDQVLWCFLKKAPDGPLEEPEFMHEIEADEDRDVVGIVDGLVWEYIIGHFPLPPKDDVYWRDFVKGCGGDESIWEHGLRADWRNRDISADPWGHVVVKRPNDAWLPEILLKWPFDRSRILSVEEVRPRVRRRGP